MRYLMKQKIFAWGDDFTIKDEAGNDAFFVDGRAFSIGNKLSFQDMTGNELAFIQQRLLSWGPTYEILRNGELVATVKKNFSRCSDASSASTCQAQMIWRRRAASWIMTTNSHAAVAPLLRSRRNGFR